MTSNETIEGLQIRQFEKFKNKKLIIDMSSDICSYNFDWDNIAYVYAGAQKNLGIPGVTICIFEKEFANLFYTIRDAVLLPVEDYLNKDVIPRKSISDFNLEVYAMHQIEDEEEPIRLLEDC